MQRFFPYSLAMLVCIAACSGAEDGDADGGGGNRRDGSMLGPDGQVITSDGSVQNGDGGNPPAPACDPACEAGEVCNAGTCTDEITGLAGIDDVLLGDPVPFEDEVGPAAPAQVGAHRQSGLSAADDEGFDLLD